MKKKIVIGISIIGIIMILICGYIVFKKQKRNNNEVNTLKELPKPEITGGTRGELGIDKNINESNIDEYLNRSDSVYRDMRMLEDPGDYEKIGGDRFLSGYVDGFEVISLPYIIPVTGLPKEVGDTYSGTTLFANIDGRYIANYEESIGIIEKIFPKDKVIFLMCGGGGYAGMTKNFLVSLGWDENKIYNVGGYWYYNGNHKVQVKKELDGKITYDFDKVKYHAIEFDKLTKSKEYREPTVKVSELKINTKQIEIEEGASFKLNVIVLPNEASNKGVKWKSNDEKIAIVDGDGLVRGISAGKATIIVQSVEGNKETSCEVTVKKAEKTDQIKLDNITNEAKEYEENNDKKISKEFDDLVNGNEKSKYYNENGGVNDLWRVEYEKNELKREQALKKRVQIINKLVEEKKSFVFLMYTKECEGRDYSVADGAAKILKDNGYSYLYVSLDGGETGLDKTKLDTSNLKGGSINIIKDGKVVVAIDPSVDVLRDENEVKNWIKKYIDIK